MLALGGVFGLIDTDCMCRHQWPSIAIGWDSKSPLKGLFLTTAASASFAVALIFSIRVQLDPAVIPPCLRLH